ncbi:MAG TPA: competence/damage-inducible protein A [Acidimicrobiales bacterium]|nr:competence/damage-inducible protein A [Acidimicrobiales bacterium]
MRVEIVAIGTELLLGQITDTNSSWMGDRLALAGIDSHFQTKVGDNLERMVQVLRVALSRSDAVICCGGLGPTQDDITREAIAQVMNAPLVRHDDIADRIRRMFEARGREMPENNLLQADVPVGATVIDQVRGTAPGLICPVGHKVVYAVPGVPYEMTEMMERAVVPDLQARAGTTATILSRTIKTWGAAESKLAELLAPRLEALDGGGGAAGGTTIAFNASGIEGIKVRITAKAPDAEAAKGLLSAEEAQVRLILGDLVFGVDDDTMESTVGHLLRASSWTLGVAESLTGGLVGSRLTNVIGASEWLRGSIVSYASEVKFSVLGVPEGPVVSAEAAAAMAAGARRVLGADVGLSYTGVAGPAEQDGQAPGTVFVGLALAGVADGDVETAELRLPGDRERVRQFAAISGLDLLRKRLLALAAVPPS